SPSMVKASGSRGIPGPPEVPVADCAICGREQADMAYACSTCAGKARRWLGTSADLAGPARDVAHGQRGRGLTVGAPSSEARLPFNISATSRIDAVTNAITGWARVGWDHRGGQPDLTGDPLEAAARYLAGEVEWLRHQQFAEEAFDVIDRCARVLAAIADRPAERRYAGPCACGPDLYARPGSDVARCRMCGTDHQVAERLEWMRGQIEDRLARPVEIAGVLLRLGVAVGYST